MTERNSFQEAAARVLDPQEVEGVLSSSFYYERAKAVRKEPEGQKPTHYKVICISMYTDDLRRLDAMVDHLKARGLTKANRSALIRHALNALDLDTVPRGL